MNGGKVFLAKDIKTAEAAKVIAAGKKTSGGKKSSKGKDKVRPLMEPGLTT